MTICFEKYLSGESTIVSKDSGIHDTFDLFIFSIGWESRCTAILKYVKDEFSSNSVILLSYKVGEIKGYQDSYYDNIKNYIRSKKDTKNIYSIEDDPTNLHSITDKIDNVLIDLINELKRPLNIGIDISSCPRYFFLYLLSYCLKNNIANNLSFFYSEGNYKTNIEEYMHTNGLWSIIEIPNFNGIVNPENKDLFIISAGFEAKRCKSIINKYEPEKIGILIPNPGFNDDYTIKASIQGDMLKKDFFVPDEYIVTAPASDAIAAWSELKNSCFANNNDNLTYVTIGPKPHILAMGIHGFLNNGIITYRIPESYTNIEVEHNNVFWRYDIHNLIF